MGLENIYQRCHRGVVLPSNSRVVAYYVGTLMASGGVLPLWRVRQRGRETKQEAVQSFDC